MSVAAPGRFSMTSGWPSSSDTFGCTMRMVMSDPPAAAYGTMTRIGRTGNDCPTAAAAARLAPSASVYAYARRAVFMRYATLSVPVDELACDACRLIGIRRSRVIAVDRNHLEFRPRDRLRPAFEHATPATRRVRTDDECRTADALDVFA